MIYYGMCVYCRHKHDDEGDGNMTCEAFPGGIPDEIIRVGYDHREPYDGDGGIMFEPDGPVDVEKLEQGFANSPWARRRAAGGDSDDGPPTGNIGV